MPKTDTQTGLTLIEVLVALAVLASAVGAILIMMSTQTRNAAALRDNALARIVAENAMVEIALGVGEGDDPSPSGTAEIGGTVYEWQANRDPAPLPRAEIVSVAVRRADSGQEVAQLSTLRRIEDEQPLSEEGGPTLSEVTQ
ncbi:type II secretion system minor pseudopilin GspI [Parvularcula oceani]|uniref:type II secretion system minor pseudopilin GspI n=1 Tax=Parvularcula oceani TaxID=1247963 RepID=UPI0004E10405|nr:type II secretion system minor pseudopilin GspI [Parvularcula oceani]